jgi:hypothetical protein
VVVWMAEPGNLHDRLGIFGFGTAHHQPLSPAGPGDRSRRAGPFARGTPVVMSVVTPGVGAPVVGSARLGP